MARKRPYKGKIQMDCQVSGLCLVNTTENINPSCLDCSNAEITILDLDEKPIHEGKSPNPTRKGNKKGSENLK